MNIFLYIAIKFEEESPICVCIMSSKYGEGRSQKTAEPRVCEYGNILINCKNLYHLFTITTIIADIIPKDLPVHFS